MLVIATNPAPYLSIVLGVFGICGVIFTALRYNRDDSTAVLTQQNTILTEMKTLNDELRMSVTNLREENQMLKQQVNDLTTQVRIFRDN